ncbi:MAG: mRNA interferase YafQ [Candidatus Entotheonella factor]|uniref:mRNA interferase YafQ n=1 Tax=Entotheonella factor TaxID=1429438 RepID=W4L290_ENTF1|nr:MAG: mRNA interferase YafQ [Candidatus Entotheonella factor]
MLIPQETTRFRRDFRRVRRRGKDLEKLRAAVRMLVAEELLPERMRDHALVGDWRGCRECHIDPDWLLIYQTDPEAGLLTLVRTGSHADLFNL